MKSFVRLKFKIFFTIITVFLYGCGEDISEIKEINNPDKKMEAYFRISINRSSNNMLRSNPTGGENGDGDETGSISENKINNLTVVFFKGSNISSSLDNIVDNVIYVPSSDISGNTTITQKISIAKDEYRLIVIANAGNLTSQLNGKTVRQIADYILNQAWTAGATPSDFVMTSVSDDFIDLSIKTTPSSPASVQISLERIAARVDIIPSNTIGESKNNYIIGTPATANITITKAKLINKFTAGIYLLKHTASSISSTVTYYGNESPLSGNQTNYVIDPWSSQKSASNLSGTPFMLSGSNVAASSLYADYYNTGLSLSVTDNIGSSDYTLGYTLENTTDKDCQFNGYTTGVIFETIYTPLSVQNYSFSGVTGSVSSISNSSQITFFTNSTGTDIYNSLEAITFGHLKYAQPANDFFSKTFDTSNTWQELLNYADRIHDNDPLGFRTYLLNELTGKTLTDNLTKTISWATYIFDQFGYSKSGSTVSINQNSKNTTQELSGKGIKCYANGICYYPYWIRHSNDNTSNSAIMEFAVVRNNIYKLKVVSFSGLGKQLPYLPGTDLPGNEVEESSINLQISVKPWKLLEHPIMVL
jgi:hypothetical protein